MLKVRNKHTGVETWYPDNQAHWLVKIGKCEIVEHNPKKTYQTKVLKAESEDVAIQPKSKKPENPSK